MNRLAASDASPFAACMRAWARSISGQSGWDAAIGPSMPSAALGAPRIRFLETRASCACAAAQGSAKAGHGVHAANSRDSSTFLIRSFLGDFQDLIGFYISQKLYRSAGPPQFNLFDPRVGTQSERDTRVGRSGVASGRADRVALNIS